MTRCPDVNMMFSHCKIIRRASPGALELAEYRIGATSKLKHNFDLEARHLRHVPSCRFMGTMFFSDTQVS